MYLDAAYSGKRTLPPAPDKYMMFTWRREMHASYDDFLRTPLEVIYTDLQTIDIENRVKNLVSERNNGTDRRR